MDTAPIPAKPRPPIPKIAAAAGDTIGKETEEIAAADSIAVPPATISEASTPWQLLEQELRPKLDVRQT